ncbi:uncharacterized protein Afti isoform X2 [Drosophila bipectinata]|uniref:uncharacterized protein Afti isoform X2 n=1 Tax=Drosophila bipectinata TaxID=42026 RepID=UPI001C8A3508|nr:uncharacterized protein LOC108127295 isoform X1 [Drosophila bipectinata]
MVNVPPLLCSTPPPIDFGEEDDDSGLQSTMPLEDGDEFPEYGLVSNAKEPPSSLDSVVEFPEKPPDYLQGMKKDSAVEAFNYQVKQSAGDYDVYREVAPPTPPPFNSESEEENQKRECEAEPELDLEEEVPSLKLDSLSLYSTESGSAASTLSPVQVDEEPEMEAVHPVMPKTKANVLSHQVTLEDVTDDSDEECSPKKPKELFIREGAEDFFAIEVVPTCELSNGEPKEHPSKKSSEDAERSVSGVVDTPNGTTGISEWDDISKEAQRQPEKTADSTLFHFSDFQVDSKEVPLQQINPGADAEADNDFDDFVDFADFSNGEPQAPFTLTAPVTSLPSQIPVLEPPSQTILPQDAADDGFDDFQEFASSASPPPPPTQAIPATQNQIEDNAEEDDDDFGDFSEPVVCQVSVPPPPPPAAVHLSINERVKPVLDSMFPRDNAGVQEKPSTDHQRPLGQCQRFNFGAIEQARALDYQWSSSEMRHALVRSLGIDPRNILFGEKWNSSMPRFAANLSFDPLKPLKPLTPSNAIPQQDAVSNPTTSFPESHVQTLQLEQLDQLTVVANADKINLVTSNSHTKNNNSCVDDVVAATPFAHRLDDKSPKPKPPVMDSTSQNNQTEQNQLTIDLHHSATTTPHFATTCKTNNNNNNYINRTNNHSITATISIDTNPTAHDASLLEFSLETAAGASQAGQAETRTGPSHGEGFPADAFSLNSATSGFAVCDERVLPSPAAGCEPKHPTEPPAATPAAVVAATTAALPTALPADSPAHQLNGGEQLHQQQPESEQLNLRATSSPLPEEIMGGSVASYAVPLKETHIYTPSKSDTAVAKTTMAPIDFDYEMAATGIKIDETVVKKEYRDVEYKPPFSLDSPSKVPATFELPPPDQKPEDDDFSDFQSMPAPKSKLEAPTFGEQMILSPAILLPQAIPLAKKTAAATSIEWGDNSLASINAEEMARIEELFSNQSKTPTISASVAKKPKPPAQTQQPPTVSQDPVPAPSNSTIVSHQEEDEWSDFVSVPVPAPAAPAPPSNNNNFSSVISSTKSAPKEDEWSDFVSSTLPAPPAPQFNSGAWQSANFYNNPLSLYQQQQQHHSNLIPARNNNNNNCTPSLPQQIHIMHDFSTAPVSGNLAATGITYQQQHQRQQFQIGNAKVAPRISLIPDLSFVAPALPTNAGAFMGVLPKPSFGGGGKK